MRSRSDVNFQISRAGLSHPAWVFTNQIACFTVVIIQLLDETEQNIVIYQWRADQLFADAEGRGKSLICSPLINHDILR